MGKALEAGQLASYLVVDTTTSNINIGTGVTISASNGSLSATSLIGDGSDLTFSTLKPNEFRNNSVSETITSDAFNSGTGIVTLNYGDDSNVVLCSNATSNIVLKVQGIPTTSDFDNQSLSFSVIAVNTGAARTCTAVYFNNQLMPIKWFGGSLEYALSGAKTSGSSGYDIFNFIGINTVGSASNISNYEVLGIVNGNFF